MDTVLGFPEVNMSTLQQQPTVPGHGPAGGPVRSSGQQPPQGPPQAYARPPAPTPPKPRNRRPGWLAMSAVAVVAALAASGTTAALVQQEPSAVSGTTVTRVVQGNTANPDWSATAAAAGPSVVSIAVRSTQGEAEGSGVVLDTAGHIVTNHHVVAGGGQLEVTLSDRRVYAARVVATDPSTDLAVIQLSDPPGNLAPMTFGEVTGLRVGQPVMALGNPLGLSETVTTGIISALDRPVVTTQEPSGGGSGARGAASSAQVVTNAIQTNAAINPGNSGGALVNANGELIGITSSIATLGSSQGQSGNLGIGFAIPADQVKAVTDELIANGKANHAYLGVATSDTGTTVNGAGYVGAGVQSVSEGTPAAAAGLRVGDVIIGVEKEPVTGSEGLIAQVRDRRPGDTVTLQVVRGGAEVGVPVTLATAPN
ncbi:trypsin-like peptidase domain-containing protein [Ammonicoccus fulvus]|uniref:Trypsin-like peptidase domain-containing protein n=1 Tax=Ammonicoccus fulvus TaxID=3138240 RepID=A0ABZ3FS93_9ACTN